ncbi:MAG TPA: molybdopterin-dependent oxidoreductase, partial [Pyrinomonadaceae bacterium]|nr:molybdopterin-dependent oxidoreductase [Pyrinomonadaceae bacterium]
SPAGFSRATITPLNTNIEIDHLQWDIAAPPQATFLDPIPYLGLGDSPFGIMTPGVGFDWSVAKGHPFAYHVFGTAIVGATVDCLRGTYVFDYVKCCHDFGQSMNSAVDRGQIEGGIVQGIGWMTIEEVVYDSEGRLRSNALSTYKIPDVYSVPDEIAIEALETTRPNLAVFNSKAVGEPPLMYGIGAYFAIREAVKAFDKENLPAFDAPFTAEKVLMNLHRS